MTVYFIQACIYLCAAVIAVPLAKRLGLGSVLGYLIAGVVIGPVTGLVGSEATTIQHFAEFGVVMMLFLVGLELEPRMLWEMRTRLLGLGGLQVSVTALIIMGVVFSLDYGWRVSLAVGLILSLSSTAIVLQTFNEKGLTKTEGGRGAFSVLLFQDIAVIPMLAFIPLLAMPELFSEAASTEAVVDAHHESYNLAEHLPSWLYALVILAAVSVVVFGGHYLSRPLFRFIANTGLREMFTATALLLVVGIAALMSLVGLSPALGTFLAGVVMANSEFRHELESNIEPFKGLLLGLFFITVGAGINFVTINENLFFVLSATFGVILIKSMVLFALGAIFKLRKQEGWLLALSLAQAGEFGFVLLSFASQNHVLPKELVALLSPVIALSMFLTPLLFIIFDKVVSKLYQNEEKRRDADTIDDSGAVVIAGIGRFGQIVNRLLVANGIKTVLMDHSPTIINNLGKVNIKTYYGDATRPELLQTAGLEEASLFVVAIDDRYGANSLVEYVKHRFPKVIVLARAYDRAHCYELKTAGADYVITETYHSALEAGSQALKQLGMHPFKAEQLKHAFLDMENRRFDALFETWKQAEAENKFGSSYIELFIELEKELAEVMRRERHASYQEAERGWTPPPKQLDEEIT